MIQVLKGDYFVKLLGGWNLDENSDKILIRLPLNKSNFTQGHAVVLNGNIWVKLFKAIIQPELAYWRHIIIHN